MNLTALQNSPFLMALGWAIANSIWQAGLLWAAYHLIAGYNGKLTSKQKNLISTSLVFTAFSWFIYTLITKIVNSIPVAPTTDVSAISTNFVTGSFLDLNFLLSGLQSSLPYFSVAYIILLFIFLIKFFRAYKNSLLIRTQGIIAPPVDWLNFTNRAASEILIQKKIAIWFSTYINVPATVGFLKPIILIPLASINQLTTDQLEAIILHELAHIKRNDYLINIFISVVETILFFNPFIVLLVKTLKKERENCCDDLVIHYKYDRHAYASALVSLEKTRLNQYPLALTATSSKSQLFKRVKRIIGNGVEADSFNYGQKLLSLLTITAIIISISWVFPDPKLAKVSKPKELNKDINQVRKSLSIHKMLEPHEPLFKNEQPVEKISGDNKPPFILSTRKKQQVPNPQTKIIWDEVENDLLNFEFEYHPEEKLNTVINHSDDLKNKKEFDFSFNIDLATIQKNIDMLNWNEMLPGHAFETFNRITFDKEVEQLLNQSQDITELKKTVQDKQALLGKLNQLYKEKEVLRSKKTNDDAYRQLRQFKTDSLHAGKLMELYHPEHTADYFYQEVFAEANEEYSSNNGLRYKIESNRKPVLNKRAPVTHKKISLDVPVSIDINGQKLIMDSKGLRLGPGKTSHKNVKKVVLALGEKIVHINLED